MADKKLLGSRDPKMLVPVHISDFLGDYTYVAVNTMKEVFDAFNPLFSKSKDFPCIIELRKHIIEMHVVDPMSFNSTTHVLHEIQFEKAMKVLPTNRIIKLSLTVFDVKENIEYKTNGVRLLVATETNFTRTLQDLIDKINPEADYLKLVGFEICGGIHSLACDEIPDYQLHFEDVSDSD